jgi:mediator of RNA polymerase II transcription subunit 13, fungi type
VLYKCASNRTCRPPCVAVFSLTLLQGDFEAVAFRAFSVRRTTTATNPTTAYGDRPVAEDTRAIEAELRCKQHLVVHDAAKPWVWLFGATLADSASHAPPDLPPLEGYQLHGRSSYARFVTATC